MTSSAHYGDLQSSLEIKRLASEDAKRHALRLLDDAITNRLWYADSIEDLLKEGGRIESLNQYGNDGMADIGSMLLEAFDCTEEKLGEIMTHRMRAATIMTAGSRYPEGIEQLYIVIGKSRSGQKPVPVFERRAPGTSP